MTTARRVTEIIRKFIYEYKQTYVDNNGFFKIAQPTLKEGKHLKYRKF